MSRRASRRADGVRRKTRRRGPPGIADVQWRNDAIAITQAIYASTLWDMAREGAYCLPAEKPVGWNSLDDERVADLRDTAAQWASRLSGCAGEVWIYGCPKHGTKKTVCSCCNVPCCPRRERRYSQGWVHRVERLSADLERYGIGLNPDAERVSIPRDCMWMHIEVSPRQRGDVFEMVDTVVKLRAALVRHLRKEYGMIAGIGAIEREGSAHLHVIALCRYVPRSALQHWLRSRDCTVRHCHHPADDRCADCKREKRACHHPEAMPDGRLRARCNGSWYVHIERCYERDKDGRRIKSARTVAGAVREAVKYASKPTKQGKSPHRFTSDEEWRSELEHAREAMLFHLALKGRHRVETYGLLKKRAEGEDDAIDDVEPRQDGEAPRCPDCIAEGLPGDMHCMRYGSREHTRYAWAPPARGS